MGSFKSEMNHNLWGRYRDMAQIDNKWTALVEENQRLRAALEKIAEQCEGECVSWCSCSGHCFVFIAREALKEDK